MVIVAHPGDEAFGFAGAIADAATIGAYIVVVCVTRGWFDQRLVDKPPAPGGKNRDVKDNALTWRNIDTEREDEMRRSVALLGVRVLRNLDYAEGQLAEVDIDELTSRIVEPIRMHRPEVICTFGPEGVTRDPDHVALSRAATAAYDAAAIPVAYEDDLEEDQVAWRAAKLYHLVVPRDVVETLFEHAPPDYGSDVGGPLVQLNLGDLSELKLAAMRRHVTQTGSVGAFNGWPRELRDRWIGSEHYRLVRSALPVHAGGAGEPETTLFDGLP